MPRRCIAVLQVAHIYLLMHYEIILAQPELPLLFLPRSHLNGCTTRLALPASPPQPLASSNEIHTLSAIDLADLAHWTLRLKALSITAY
jgi:hypothetical protein